MLVPPCGLSWRGHMEGMPRKKNYPKTVPAAVEYCLKTLNVGTLKEVALLEDDAGTHFGLGMWIRNSLGLWRGNRELVEAMGWCHHDDASGPIGIGMSYFTARSYRTSLAVLRSMRSRQLPCQIPVG